MISIDVLVTQMSGLHRQDLERWIANRWVRPDDHAGYFLFGDMDVARVGLIRELRDELKVNEDALPIVLSLLDQLYDLRRRMRQLSNALGQTVPEEVRQNLVKHLADRASCAEKMRKNQ
jgi:chaperone modulatory protein CbpM